MKLEKSVTILYSTDIRKSLEYFTEKLGFKQVGMGRPADIWRSILV
ncbi:MAG: hypothetical protein JST87_19880 [Bacteroidetes bacterium]|nr:hypothetical protein [Bacteroidota bacterium]